MPLSGGEMMRLFLQAGWVFKSQSGSHVKLEKNGRIVIIPMHRELKKGTEHGLFKKLRKVL